METALPSLVIIIIVFYILLHINITTVYLVLIATHWSLSNMPIIKRQVSGLNWDQLLLKRA